MKWHNPPHTWIKAFSKQIFLKQVAKEENREESEAGRSPALWARPSAEAPFDLTSPRTKAEKWGANPAFLINLNADYFLSFHSITRRLAH